MLDQMMVDQLNQRNQRIIDAVIKKSEKLCPGAIAMIGIYGSFCTGDIYEKSDLDLMIVVEDDRGWQISCCFFLGDVAHDIYCTRWMDLEQMANYEDPNISKLMDSKIVYCREDSYLHRLEELREKVHNIMNQPFGEKDIIRVEQKFQVALKCLATVHLEEETGRCRLVAAQMLINLEEGICLLNQTYFHKGNKRRREEMQEMKRMPEGFLDLADELVQAETIEFMRATSCKMMRSVQNYFEEVKSVLRAKNPKKDLMELTGSYEEIYSNWRNKMYLAERSDNALLAYMTVMECQEFYYDIAQEFGINYIDITSGFSASNLTKSAQEFDRGMHQYRKICEQAGIKFKEYKTMEEFEEDYFAEIKEN